MPPLRPILLLAILAACLGPCLASAQSVSMARLTTADGLSQSTVHAVLQDRRGFMWFATSDGLNRYDGYDFTVYRHTPDDANSPSSNVVTCLYEDDAGTLWLCTANAGVDRFDPETGSFTHYRHRSDDPRSLSSNDATFIDGTGDGRLWIGTQQNGLNLLDPATGHVRRFTAPPDGTAHFMNALARTSDGRLWVAATLLLELNPEAGTLTPHFGDRIEGVRDLLAAPDGSLWIGTSHGLAHVDPHNSDVTLFPPRPDATADASANHVDELLRADDGTLWVGTPDGLFRFDPSTGTYTAHLRHDPAHPGSLVGSSIHALYRDPTGLLWIGTADAGLSVYDPRRAAFTYYRHHPGDAASLFEPNVHAVHVDPDGTIWLGTSEGVVTRFEPGKDRYTHFQHDADDPRSLPAGYFVRALARAPGGPLWVGGWNAGANRMDDEAGRFTRLHEQPGGLASQNVLSILPGPDGSAWIGTVYGGLHRLDPTAGSFRVYRHDPDDPRSLSGDAVNVLYRTRDDALWAGTWTGGVSRYVPSGDHFVTYRHDPDDPRSLAPGGVNALLETRDGTLWAGTLGGLNRYDPETDLFRRLTEPDELAGTSVQALLEDETGRLWISTRRGLIRYDPAAGTSRSYDVDDGLPTNEFHDGAAARGPDGRLYFGTNKGLLVVDPARITPDRHIPPVVLTELRLLNEPVAPGSARLPRALWATDSLTLTHRDVAFSLAFAALSYGAPDKSRYRYRLAGLESEWNEVGSRRREARYSSLPPGDYVFQVQAANADGIWNRAGIGLHVTVRPAWWGTWWFRLLAAAAGLGVVVALVGRRLHASERHRRALARQVEARTHELALAKDAAEAANRAKSTFLANMSHELRTPLNAVLGFAELMSRDAQTPAAHREHLGVIRRSGTHLLDLINDVLDMSKIEAGRITAEPSAVPLSELLDNLHDLFALRARQKGLTLHFERAGDLPQCVLTDERKLRQVLLNLLSNAVKFTERGGVTLRVDYHDDRLALSVADTGPGIDAHEVDCIFEPFVQAPGGHRNHEGTGLGLAISRRFAEVLGGRLTCETAPGSGTTFRLEVPAPVARSVSGSRAVPAAPPVAGRETTRLLVVDDQPDNRHLLIEVLRRASFDVRAANDGEAALREAAAWRPHLVLLDRRMPGLDGDAVARRLKQQADAPAVVALTASSLAPERDDLAARGYDDFLAKPFEQDHLFALLARHLPDDDEPPPPAALDREALAAQPRAWRAAFRHAAVRGRTGDLLRLTREVSPRDPALAAVLEDHVRHFRLEALLHAADTDEEVAA